MSAWPLLTLIGIVAVAGSACARPAAPTPVTAEPLSPLSYEGTWSGAWQGSCGNGPPGRHACGSVLGSALDEHQLELALRESPNGLAGTLMIRVNFQNSFSSEIFQEIYSVPVTGAVDAAGTLTLTGESAHTPPTLCGYETFTRLDRWTVTRVDPGARLTGSFAFTRQRGISSCYFGDFAFVGDLSGVVRTGR